MQRLGVVDPKPERDAEAGLTGVKSVSGGSSRTANGIGSVAKTTA
jgi:hypothetical protein